MGEPTWEGALDRGSYSELHLRNGDELADAARDGRWRTVLALLRDEDKHLDPNRWRVGGRSWFTPLHQAAWHGAPPDVVEELISLGSSRTLPTSAGQRALDIALEKGHAELKRSLEPVMRNGVSGHVLAMLDRHLAALVEDRIRPQLTIQLRPLTTAILTEREPGASIWFPVPGMYGGFNVRLETSYLDVKSWSRIVGGSGQAHVITEKGSTLVAEGFV